MIGSFFAASALGSLGMTRVYGGALLLMAAGFGVASAAPTIAVAALLAGVATIGNGAAIVCNQVLVQRGAPDAMRGRALAVLMSSYYAVLGLAMAGAGILVDAAGARTAWALAGIVYAVAGVLAFAFTRRTREVALPESRAKRRAGGLERLRVLMNEVDETRRREQQRGAIDVALRRRTPRADPRRRVPAVAGRGWTQDALVAGVLAGDRRALARAISLVEERSPEGDEIVRRALSRRPDARRRSA